MATTPRSKLTESFTSLTPASRSALMALVILTLMSLTRVISGANDLTSAGTVGASLRLAVPIAMAGLGGIFAERVGVVNIALEGMMVLGTWFGAYGAITWGGWAGIAFGIFGGMLGGLLHAAATITFKVDHIISGVAINIMAPGVTRFLTATVWDRPTESPTVPLENRIGTFTVPGVSSGLKSIEDRHWLLISDLAGVLRGLTTNMSWVTVGVGAIIAGSSVVLWRTRFGLRLRSIGENPYAAESLGVPVVKMQYLGVLISGACAGLGGAFLATVQNSQYKEAQTGGRGFIGLATMIFGNWRPGGLASGAGLFGFAQALPLRQGDLVDPLLLFVAMLCALVVIRQLLAHNTRKAIGAAIAGAAFLTIYLTVDELPQQFIQATPYVVTLVVLATASQRLRPPAAAGQVYRRGGAH
jgi:simple sugar transport system permease protein